MEIEGENRPEEVRDGREEQTMERRVSTKLLDGLYQQILIAVGHCDRDTTEAVSAYTTAAGNPIDCPDKGCRLH
jgi:hypothetical protein